MFWYDVTLCVNKKKNWAEFRLLRYASLISFYVLKVKGSSFKMYLKVIMMTQILSRQTLVWCFYLKRYGTVIVIYCNFFRMSKQLFSSNKKLPRKGRWVSFFMNQAFLWSFVGWYVILFSYLGIANNVSD